MASAEFVALVRHASAEAGRDPALTAYGRLQASALGPIFQGLTPLSTMIVSPLTRAIETATLALENVDGVPPPTIDQRAAPGCEADVLLAFSKRSRRILVVTHDDIIGAVCLALTGTRRLGYERASVTVLRPKSGGWEATYYSPPDVD
jgi:broad specificity phosphatase PhoE